MLDWIESEETKDFGQRLTAESENPKYIFIMDCKWHNIFYTTPIQSIFLVIAYKEDPSKRRIIFQSTEEDLEAAKAKAEEFELQAIRELESR